MKPPMTDARDPPPVACGGGYSRPKGWSTSVGSGELEENALAAAAPPASAGSERHEARAELAQLELAKDAAKLCPFARAEVRRPAAELESKFTQAALLIR